MISIAKPVNKKLPATICLILFSFLLYSQHIKERSERFTSSSSVDCSASDYQFQVGTVLYNAENTILLLIKKSGKGFICEADIPVVITIYSKNTGNPIVATDVKWTGDIDGTYGNLNQGQVSYSHFMNTDFATFGATFTENGQVVELKDFKLSTDVKVVALKSKNPGGFYDTVRDSSGNYINEYWPSHTPAKEKPWLFVPTGGTQNLELSVKSKAGKKPGKDAWKAMTVNPNGAGMNITLNKFMGDDSGFNVGQSINTSTPYPFVSSCTDTVAYIYSQPGSSYGLEFKLIAFTHDDQQINFGPVASDTTTCVTVGADGFYTEAFRKKSPSYRGGPYYVHLNDSISFTTSYGESYVTKIMAGADLICNTAVPANNTFYNQLPSISQWVNTCNSVYSDIGVSFSTYSYDTIYMPELYLKDNKLDGDDMKIMNLLNPLQVSNNIMVYLVDVIAPNTNVRGRATNFGVPKVAVAAFADGNTLAHEIGHGKFSLRHPDNDPDHLGNKDGDIPPVGGPFKFGDKENFMFSNAFYRVNRIRHYQWKKILTGTYNN